MRVKTYRTCVFVGWSYSLSASSCEMCENKQKLYEMKVNDNTILYGFWKWILFLDGASLINSVRVHFSTNWNWRSFVHYYYLCHKSLIIFWIIGFMCWCFVVIGLCIWNVCFPLRRWNIFRWGWLCLSGQRCAWTIRRLHILRLRWIPIVIVLWWIIWISYAKKAKTNEKNKMEKKSRKKCWKEWIQEWPFKMHDRPRVSYFGFIEPLTISVEIASVFSLIIIHREIRIVLRWVIVLLIACCIVIVSIAFWSRW